jgi:thiamine-phosphate pyrophosphorylase
MNDQNEKMTDRRRLVVPKLYAITDTRLSGLSHAAQVSALCAAGAKLIQLREKTLGAEDFCVEAKQALAIARTHGAQLLINDRVDVALAIGADGVHLGQDDLPVLEARRLLGEQSIIGFSTHNAQQAKTALTLPIDYVAVGPIFPTTTKNKPDPTLGLGGLRKIRESTRDFSLVAIGGIDPTNARGVLAAGADSVAIVSWLVSDPLNIQARTREILSII